MSRQQRAAVAAETTRILGDGGYIAPSGRRVDLCADIESAVARTRLYLPHELPLEAAEPAARLQTSIQVTGESTLAATRRLAATTDSEVGALNFASARHPGGGFLSGASAQEESLARASGLYACLQAAPDFYRYHRANRDLLYSDRVVYSPSVPVFRDDAGGLLEKPYRIAILTAAAPNAGALLEREPSRLAEVRAALRSRSAKVLATAHRHGHRVLVLGAWGCGVFGNDPEDMAAVFAEHLLDGAFTGRFAQVLFAVLDPTPDRRIQKAFARTFG
ncbi:MAG TPA: TIGR02452 family protein [Actinomycetes bacterium]|jgi:uncharacterized protein (TIGR02452 family)|nr:TIGR02452 family protein [Actinomycetes bacterium]